MAVPVVLVTAGARPVTAVESGGFPMTPVDTLGEPVTLVDAGGEPITLINEDGSPAFLAYSAKEYLNGIAPYHWFDFINDRALYASNDVGGVSGATGYSFSRASAAYYTNSDGTLTSFASGALRQGDRGVLIEGARTNLLVRSQEFDNASWTKAGGSISADATAAPDGTVTADLFTEDTSTGLHRTFIIGVASAASGVVYTSTIFVKPNGRTFARFSMGGAGMAADRGADFNLTTLEVANINSGVGAIEALANGWLKLTVTATTTATGQVLPILNLTSGLATASYTGDGSSGLYLWGAQLEAASFPSSYIPTTTTSATRAADVLTCTLNGTEELAAAAAASPELVTNGGFDADASWTKGTGWTIGSGVATKTAGSAAFLSQSVTLSAGVSYLVTFTATVTAGTVQPQFSGGVGVSGTARNASGTYTELLLATSGDNTFRFLGNSAFAGTVDVVSVKEVPAEQTAIYPISLWAEFERAVDTGGQETYLHIDDGTGGGADVAQISVNNSDLAQLSVTSTAGGGAQAAVTIAGAIAINTITKTAGRVATNSAQFARGGTLGTEDTVVVVPATATRLIFGTRQNGASPVFGYLRRAAIFSSALSDANLQSTTGS